MEKAWASVMAGKAEEGDLTGEDFKSLDGGFPSLALKGITGGDSGAFWRSGGSWARMGTTIAPADHRYMDGNFAGTGGSSDDDEVFAELLKNDEMRRCQFGAICDIGGEQPDDNGLVKGHAYSIIEVKQVTADDGKIWKLLKMRNPWGKFEWKGDWGDTSSKWEEYPEVEEACKLERADDGIFWICFDDFKTLFNLVEFSEIQMEGPKFDELQLQKMQAARDEEGDDEEKDVQLEEAVQLFEGIDPDGDGSVQFKEFWEWIKAKDLTWVSRRDARQLMKELDTDDSGALSGEELLKMVSHRPLENEIEHRIREFGGYSRIRHKQQIDSFRRERKSFLDEFMSILSG